MTVIDVMVRPTLEQRMSALDKANEIRSYRKQLKADLKAGRVLAADVLSEPVASHVRSMKVRDLLRAMPMVGVTKADKALRWADVAPSKTVGGLSPRQRAEVLRMVAAGGLDYQLSERFQGRREWVV